MAKKAKLIPIPREQLIKIYPQIDDLSIDQIIDFLNHKSNIENRMIKTCENYKNTIGSLYRANFFLKSGIYFIGIICIALLVEVLI